MIAIIDYGAGNLQSVSKALDYIGCKSFITSCKEELLNADGAILPGVGSFGDAMDCMHKNDFDKSVIEFINTGKPLLGICLGLHLLFPSSDESPNAKGLSILKGKIKRIPDNGVKVPHMGWNSLIIKNNKNGLYKGIENNAYVYFVHSYFLKADDRNIVTAETNYSTMIDASIQYKNVIATQFHPEKSGKVGLKILDNFSKIVLNN